ncbi:MAG: sugar phosphate nucleotidyltransferase [Thermoplasmata archaeon]|nr:sugar phosphate nucleotidyltransferase [Thermoplasmata archaeon]
MKAVILAAGEGKRLRPFTYSEPKVMIPVANRSLMDYVVRSLVSNQIRDIIIVVGYRKERIMSYFGDGDDFGANITYVNQDKQLGNGHALYVAREHIDDDFLVLPGDSLVDAKAISDLLSVGAGHGALVIESDMQAKYGVALLERNRISDIVDKEIEGATNIVLTGAYKLPASALGAVAKFVEEGNYVLSSAIRAHLPEMQLQPVFCQGLWIDAVYPWDLLEVNHAALADSLVKTSGKLENGVLIQGKVSIGEGTTIRSGTALYGPIAIGSGCDIGPNVSIFSSTSIGDNVTVEPFTFIKNSMIMSDCSIGPHSYLSQSVLGYGVQVRSHLMASSADSYVNLEDEFYRVSNIGTLVGEDCQIGNGVTIEPGMIIGPKSRISSGGKVTKNIPTGAIHS